MNKLLKIVCVCVLDWILQTTDIACTVHFSCNTAIQGNPVMNDLVLSTFMKHIFSFACLASLTEILFFVVRRPHL